MHIRRGLEAQNNNKPGYTAMRIFHIQNSSVRESADLQALTAEAPPAQGYVWVACAREEFETGLPQVQAMLQALSGNTLLDLHVSDLLNQQLPSHYDFTSQYDLLVFRRLAAASAAIVNAGPGKPYSVGKGGPPILRRIDTSPVGFAVFDRVLLSVHPTDCAAREAYATKLLQAASAESHASGARLKHATLRWRPGVTWWRRPHVPRSPSGGRTTAPDRKRQIPPDWCQCAARWGGHLCLRNRACRAPRSQSPHWRRPGA